MLRFSSSSSIKLLFAAFVLSGAVALAAGAMMLGTLIISASEGMHGPVHVVGAGALVGLLVSFIVHQIGTVAPGVVRTIVRR